MENNTASARSMALVNQVLDLCLRAGQAPQSPVTAFLPANGRRELRRKAARLRAGKFEPRYKNLYTAEELADIYERTARRDEIYEQVSIDLRRNVSELRRLYEENAPGVRSTVRVALTEARRLADEKGPGSEAERRYRLLQYLVWYGGQVEFHRRRGRPPAPSGIRVPPDPAVEARHRMSAAEALPSPPSPDETVITIPPEGSDDGRGRVFLRIGLGKWSWIGSFAPGHKDTATVQMMPGGRHLFVSAAGAGYMIDAKSRTLVETIGTDVVGVMQNRSSTLFIVNHDDVRMEAFDKAGHLWTTAPISAGGFRGLVLTDDSLVGETLDPCGYGWVGLVVNLATGNAWIADGP